MNNFIFNRDFLDKFKKKYLYLILKFLKLSLIIIILNNFFALSIIPSSSMCPTLQIKDCLLIKKTNIDIQYGDIVVFEKDNSVYVKRVVGMSGDIVEIKNKVLYLNQKPVYEYYVSSDSGINTPAQVIPAESYFVLGDNRYNSLDSRYYGSIKKEDVLGKALFIILPFQDIKKIS